MKSNNKKPRGYRNCNPGNIRISNEVFQGEIIPSQDKLFKQFITMAFGFRAMFVLLGTYYRRHNLKTIRGWITRYAPSLENYTDNYINIVCQKSGIAPDEELDITNRRNFVKIVFAMAYVENGAEPGIIDVETGYTKYLESRKNK
jgi:hypothetical protein